MKNSKKLLLAFLIIMMLSSFTITFAITDNSQIDFSYLLTVEDSAVVSHDDILKIQDEIAKLEKINKDVTDSEVNKILEKLGLSNIVVLTEEQIHSTFAPDIKSEVPVEKYSNSTVNISTQDTTPMIGWVLQGRWLGTNTPNEYSLTPYLYNASLTVLNQVAGYTRGYVEIYPNKWVKNVERYSDERFMNPGSYRNLGLMYMPVYGYGAYYVNEFVLYHDGQAVLLNAADWHNGR